MKAALLAGFLLALAASASMAQDAAGSDAAAQVERRIESVGTLIEKSSAARQIEASGNPEALAFRESARMLHRTAVQVFKAGDLAGASSLLSEAAKRVFQGARAAAPEQITGDKDKRDLEARIESVRALLAAQKRIMAEKKIGAEGEQLVAKVEALLVEVEKIARDGRVKDARRIADQAYLISKTAIGGMRGGDTLVRSLSFATPEDEYKYETDRNDTHRMLVQVLLEEKRGTGTVDAMVDSYMDKAARLRDEAEQQAGRRDFKEAIRLLEDSTKELVRAIRGAGIYIPG